jgi:alkyldihydroxyacetonephosphate synthase
MQRWNGWGEEAISLDLPPKGREMLRDLIGEGRRQPDYPIEKILQRIPDSRLPHQSLVSFDPRLRLDHAHGQGLPDWMALRYGTLQRFPDGVALPTSTAAIQDLMHFAADQNAIVIPYGGGTSVVGHLEIPDAERPVLSLSLKGLNRLIHLEPGNMLATFEAGILGPKLEGHLQPRGFTLGHYPQSFEYSSLGGWVVTRSCGQQSRYYGRIEQLFAGGNVLTPRGPVVLPPFPASAAGPDLRQLLLGSEGRMGILTNVIVKITPLPERDETYGFFFPSWEDGRKAVQTIAGEGIPYSMIRLSNPTETMTNLALAGHERKVAMLTRYLHALGMPDQGKCLCLIGFTGSARIVRAARTEARSIIRRSHGVSIGKSIGRTWKKSRFRSAYLRNTLWDLGYAVDTLETATTWDKVTAVMTAIENSLHAASASFHERLHAFSHLSHLYPSGSSIYTTFVFRHCEPSERTLAIWQALKQAASRAIVEAGATITHQHGVGTDHRDYLLDEKGRLGVETLQAVFQHLDPKQQMNPGKLVP